jgi:hypothetical protein
MSETKNEKSKALEIFEKGKEFTEELLKENEKLRMVIAKLKNERLEMENRYVKVDVPHLQRKNEILEKEVQMLLEENQNLRNQFAFVEDENQEFSDRYVEVEKQNSDLISMYVASHQLHATLDYDEVVGALKDVIINMVGAEEFGVYLVEPADNCLHMLTQEGLEETQAGPIPIDDNKIGEVVRTGEIYVDALKDGQKKNDSGEPIACIPMKVDDELLGIIVIYSLLIQKDGFGELDYELFDLIGQHGITAIYGAKLFAHYESKINTSEGFLNLIKPKSAAVESAAG